MGKLWHQSGLRIEVDYWCSFREHEVTKTSIKVVSSFIILYLPTLLIAKLNPMPPNGNLPGLHVLCYSIFWSSTFVNTCIYVLSTSFYRSALEKTFGFSMRCQKKGSYELPITVSTPKQMRARIQPKCIAAHKRDFQ